MSVMIDEIIIDGTILPNKKPRNDWQRFYEPEESASVLAWIGNGSIILEQLSTNPLIFSQPDIKKIKDLIAREERKPDLLPAVTASTSLSSSSQGSKPKARLPLTSSSKENSLAKSEEPQKQDPPRQPVTRSSTKTKAKKEKENIPPSVSTAPIGNADKPNTGLLMPAKGKIKIIKKKAVSESVKPTTVPAATAEQGLLTPKKDKTKTDKENQPPATPKTAAAPINTGIRTPLQTIPSAPIKDKPNCTEASGSRVIDPKILSPFSTPSGQHKTLPFDKITTLAGKEMTTRRHYNLTIDGRKKALLLFSPDRPLDAGDKAHHRHAETKKRNHTDVIGAKLLQLVEDHSQDTIKGGQAIPYDPAKRRRADFPQAKTVLGFSAKEAMRAEIQRKKHLWDKNTLKLMESLLDFSLEHLHCLAFSLSPATYNSQTSSNLGIAGSWINTHMMVLETVARYFGSLLKGADEAVELTPTFIMKDDSPLIDEISYEVLLKANGKELKISSKLKALTLPDRSNWPSVTDAEHIKMIAKVLLNSEPFSRRTTISIR